MTNTIITAALQHDVSKAYAEKATSRLLKPEYNEVLLKAAASEEVDVVLFRKAATAALSLAATRAGQSMARRDWTREARHLIYWADAIIDQHIEGLPIYEKGARSPKIAALEVEIEHSIKVNQNLAAEVTRLKANAEELWLAKQDAIHAAQSARLTATSLYFEINEAHAALEYAFGLLSEADKTRLAGFRDGYATRANDVPSNQPG